MAKKLQYPNLFHKFLPLFLFLQVLLASCATAIRFPVNRPAQIDSKGATSIAIFPFSSGNMIRFYYNHNSDSETVANYIQEQFQNRILQSDFFTLTSPCSPSNKGAPSYDLYIHGSIYNISNVVEKIPLETEGKKKKTYLFKRKVSLSVKYQVVYTQTEEILYSSTQHIEEESTEYAQKRELPNFMSLVSSDLRSKINSITKKLMPYTTTKKISLLKDKSKDPLIEEQMKVASKIAKEGNYSQAHGIFMEIYQRDRIFEAGYNAALLYEAMGQLDEAALLMSQIFFNTNNSKAQKALKDIQQEIRYQNQLQRQIEAQKLNETKDRLIIKEK